MGVTLPEKTVPTAEAALTRALNDQLADKGFVVAQLDKLVTWARTGSLWGLTFGLACCGEGLRWGACSTSISRSWCSW